jgi:predicted component of type VI protein secretion system
MNSTDSSVRTARASGAAATRPPASGGKVISQAEIESRRIEKLRDEVALYKARTRLSEERLAELSAQIEELKKEKGRASAEHGGSEESPGGEEAGPVRHQDSDPATGPPPPVSSIEFPEEERTEGGSTVSV